MKNRRTPGTVCVCVSLLTMLVGCATPPPSELCPNPGEFTAKGKTEPWISYEASRTPEDGDIKTIIVDGFWYAKRFGRYVIEMPDGSRDCGLRIKEGNIYISYLAPTHVRTLEEWTEDPDAIGGGYAVPFVTAPTLTVNREWQQEVDGTWALMFQFDPGAWGMGRKVKREAPPTHP